MATRGVVFSIIKIHEGHRGGVKIYRSLKDTVYDETTSFAEVLEDSLGSSTCCSEFAQGREVVVTLHNSPEFRSFGANPVSNLEAKVWMYCTPNARHVQFLATSVVVEESDDAAAAPAAAASAAAAAPPLKINRFFSMSRQPVLRLPKPHDESGNLHAQHKTYNKLLAYFDSKGLGFPDGEESQTQSRIGGTKRIGHGAKFVSVLSDLLSYCSQHYNTLLRRSVRPANWIREATVEKSSRKLSIEAVKLQGHIDALRRCMAFSWTKISAWKSHLADVRLLVNSLENYVKYLDKEAERKRTSRSSLEPARSASDAEIRMPQRVLLESQVALRHSFLNGQLRKRKPVSVAPACDQYFVLRVIILSNELTGTSIRFWLTMPSCCATTPVLLTSSRVASDTSSCRPLRPSPRGRASLSTRRADQSRI